MPTRGKRDRRCYTTSWDTIHDRGSVLGATQHTFLARLDWVRQLGQNVGWGVGDDFEHFWSEAGLVMHHEQ